jgi:transcriptional regulator with XRE-family HTH domain
MAKRQNRHYSGIYHAREARGMSRMELVQLTGISKQQLSRLENGHIRLRLDHLEPFVRHLGYSAEEMLLWGRLPGAEQSAVGSAPASANTAVQVPEIDFRADARKKARQRDAVKPEKWGLPPRFVHEQLRCAPEHLLVLEITGDGMTPTFLPGERVIVDASHKQPSPDGIYAIRDSFDSIIVRRLQLLHATKPPRVRVISDNQKHPGAEIALEDLDVVGKVVCGLRTF